MEGPYLGSWVFNYFPRKNLWLVQGMDDTEVAAMGYAELNEGVSPTSALEVVLNPLPLHSAQF